MSAQTGISAPNLSMLERGRLIPTDHDAEALATCLNVPVALLWHFNGPWLAVEPDAQENAA